MKKIFFVTSISVFIFCFFIAPSVNAQTVTGVELPEGQVELFDGFEHGNYWIWAGSDYDQWGRHKYSGGTNISARWSTEGSHSLECKIDAMPEGDTWYDGLWFFDGDQNFTGVRYIALDVYNATNEYLNISVVLQVTENWNWKQTGSQGVPAGTVTTLYFDITQFSEFLNAIRRIQISAGVSNPIKVNSRFYVDNLRLIR